jgi:gliding motility-associated-like protein
MYIGILMQPSVISLLVRWLKPFLIVLCCSTATMAQEVCDNGIDDDGNGLIDLNDSACVCQLTDLPHLRNPGFEQFTALPTAISQMNRALNWHQATYGTSDYFNSLPGGFSPPGLPNPIPSGTGMAGFTATQGGSENIGACLQYPLIPGFTYTLTFSLLGGRYGGTAANPPIPAYDPVNVNLYGRGACPSFPLPGVNDCPQSHGYSILGGVSYTSGFSWQQFTFNFTPVDTIYSIILGPQCVLPANFQGTPQGSPYFWVDEVQIILPAPFVQIRAEEEGNTCLTDWNLRAVVTHQPTVFQWYFEGVALMGQTSQILNLNTGSVGPGTYQVRATYPTGCIIDTILVEMSNLDSFFVTVEPSNCGLPSGSLRIDSVSGGVAPFLFSVDGSLASSQQFYPNLGPGFYNVTAQDAQGCVVIRNYEVGNIGPAIQDLLLDIQSVTCFDSLGVITVLDVVSGTPPFSFGLNPNLLVGDTVIEQLNAGNYVLYVRDSLGCNYQKEVEILDSCIMPPCVVLAPNIFTPNGDGINDLFGLTSDCDFEEAQWMVYNRWGELVFESRSWTDSWDGRHNGKACESGGYAYYFMGRPENRTMVTKGLISLVR